MPDAARLFSPDDLRAAVAAGLLTEAQAAGLTALAEGRAGRRAAMPAEDEPFEFFRGFSEIFVSVGLVILLTGISVFLSVFSGFAMLTLIPAICAAIAWWWAGYFTLKRRMNLPSMVLSLAFAAGIYISALTFLSRDGLPGRGTLLAAFLLTMLGMALWYRRFRLPFAMFVLGLAGLGAIYTATASLDVVRDMAGGLGRGLFDLRTSPQFAMATLIFGIAALAAAMWFDLRDRYRLGRHAATAFWLHLLAAPALVNTVAMTLYNTGGGVGVALTAAALAGITLLALVIDRRSFLTAGIVYLGLVISWVVRADGGGGEVGRWAMILILLGAILTALGTWWVPLRRAVMTLLPDFPGKDRLPPYAEVP